MEFKVYTLDIGWIKYWLPYISLVSIILLVKICKGIKRWLQLRSAPCRHGVKGGRTLNLCELCIKEEKELGLIREESEKVDIEEKVNRLRNNEIRRLTGIRLKDEERLLSLSPQQFEDAVAAMCCRLGYSVKQTPYSGDFGKDIIASRDGVRCFIECKRYQRSKRIGRPVLQKLFAAMVDEKADRGVCVATCSFTKPAREYVSNKNIELIDLNRLVLLMREAFADNKGSEYIKVMCSKCGDIVEFALGKEMSETRCINGHIVESSITEADLSPGLLSGKVYCDKCGKEMRLKDGPYGEFWGCSGYPDCKNTKSCNRSR